VASPYFFGYSCPRSGGDPFIFMHNAMPALRVSNAIAIVMLFMTGMHRTLRGPSSLADGSSCSSSGSSSLH